MTAKPFTPHPPDEDESSPLSAEDSGPTVGALVILPVPRVRTQVGCGERVGVVLEDRRNVVKVLFPEIDRTFWVDREDVLAVEEGRLPTHRLALRLHRIALRVAAVAIEVYDVEGDADVFHVFSRGTTLEALEAVRADLGPDFRRLAVDPGGVRRARLTLAFRTTP